MRGALSIVYALAMATLALGPTAAANHDSATIAVGNTAANEERERLVGGAISGRGRRNDTIRRKQRARSSGRHDWRRRAGCRR